MRTPKIAALMMDSSVGGPRPPKMDFRQTADPKRETIGTTVVAHLLKADFV